MNKRYYILFVVIFLSCVSYSNNGVDDDSKIHVQLGHWNWVSSVAISPDGKYALSGSWDKTLKLWNIATGKEIRVFVGHNKEVLSVAFSPDGKYAVTGAMDTTIRVWDIETGRELRAIRRHNKKINSVKFSPDGKSLLSGSADKTIKLFDIESEKLLKTFVGHSDEVTSVAFSPAGDQVISSSRDNTVKLWDLSTGKNIKTFTGHTKTVFSASFSPDGKQIVSGSSDKTLKIWDIENGKVLKTLSGHTGDVASVCYSTDGKYIVSGSLDKTAKLWDVASGKEKQTFKGHTFFVYSALFSPDGNSVLSGSGDGTLRYWNINDGSEIKTFKATSKPMLTVAISPNGKYALSGSMENVVKVWDFSEAKLKNTLSGHTGWIYSVAVSPDGKYALSGSADKTIKLWNIETGDEIKTFKGHTYFVKDVAFSPDGKYVVSGGWDKSVRIWEVSTGKELATIKDHKNSVNSVTFSPDGKYVLSGSGSLILSEAVSGRLVRSYNTNQISLNSVVFSPCGKYILGGSNDRTLKMWEVSTGKLIHEFKGHKHKVSAVAFSADGKYIISGSHDNTLRMWDAKSFQQKKIFRGHSAIINDVKFSVSGKQIITASGDHTMRIWDVESQNWIAFTADENGGKWLTYTKDGYWDGSTDCGDLVSMVDGMESWDIDQFAVKNNRPDIIMDQTGIATPELVAYYKSRHTKRLRKLGLTESDIAEAYEAPTAQIINSGKNGKNAELEFIFNDDNHKLKFYNIYINDVPFYGSVGKLIKGQNIKLSESVELNEGMNKIEITCINEKGAESYRASITMFNNERTNKDLYLIAFGVSQYKNQELNLAYAHKDALDLELVVQGFKGKGFTNVFTKVLTDEQVTPENIKSAKDFVKNAKPDDTFILFIAGHGMHDKDAEATYYYLTYDTNLKKLKSTAADFETIEDLLQGIPPRNKLFLMDACESGEIDDDEEVQYLASASQIGVNSRGFKKVGKKSSGSSSGSKRSYLYQKDRYIYNDLVRRSGAIVFSSSKGGELSYERSDIENGLFTEYIMKALSTTEADENKDGTVSTDELRKYVSAKVAEASGGMQHPTVDRDNIYQKFSFNVK